MLQLLERFLFPVPFLPVANRTSSYVSYRPISRRYVYSARKLLAPSARYPRCMLGPMCLELVWRHFCGVHGNRVWY